MDEPTPQMRRALIYFRARHGRYGKRALSRKWMNGGGEAKPHSASRQMLRNHFGPSCCARSVPLLSMPLTVVSEPSPAD